MINEKLILGTVQFGLKYGINNSIGRPNFNEIQKILTLAKNSEIKILDTADAYGNATEIIGSYIYKNGSVFKINTKFKIGNKSISQQLQETLTLLNLVQIDTYFFHCFEDYKKNKTLLTELEVLKKSNSILNIGLSVYDNYEFKEAIISKEIDVIQFPFNMLDNLYQREKLIKLAKSEGKKLQARSVFLQGLFFKNLEHIPLNLFPLKPYLIEIKKIAQEYRVEIEHLALCYALQQHDIDYVIIGVDNLEQLQRNIVFANKPIASEILDSLSRIIVQETKLLYPKNWN